MELRQFRILHAFMIGVIALSSLSLIGCRNEGPAERAGERIDEGARDANRAMKDAVD